MRVCERDVEGGMSGFTGAGETPNFVFGGSLKGFLPPTKASSFATDVYIVERQVH